jgi:2,3-dihydroxybenzoate decarboxylase
MQDKIAIEEHWSCEPFGKYFPESVRQTMVGSPIEMKLADIEELRLPEMDRWGIRTAILSLTNEGVQAEPDSDRALDLARKANDGLARVVDKHPARFSGFAAIPLHDGAAAADELSRAVEQLGFRGAMINGYQSVEGEGGVYLDHPRLAPFWERAEALGVPVYLHPRDLLASQRLIFEGRPELTGPAWGWGCETGTHALRILFGGVFDRFPEAKLILGHMGENIPAVLHRIEGRYRLTSRGAQLPKPVIEYFRKNVFITTSGQCRTPALLNALLEIGAERILFATDYPYESLPEAALWMDSCPIAGADREKIGRSNAESLFRIDPGLPPLL